MTDNENHQNDRRLGRDRRTLPRSKSIYKWNFDPSGSWREERRSGEDRRRERMNEDETETGS